LNFGGIGGYSVINLVKPIKTVGSWTPHDGSVNHLLLAKTEAHVRARAARVLGKSDATVRGKVRRFDSADRALYQAAKLLALFVGDDGAQILNFEQALGDEDDLCYLRNASNPRVADQLGIERQQSLRLFRVSVRRCLPLEQATRAV
jgi:hypothetical protein